MTTAESYCPHCNKKIIIEHVPSLVFPLGIVKTRKPKEEAKKK